MENWCIHIKISAMGWSSQYPCLPIHALYIACKCLKAASASTFALLSLELHSLRWLMLDYVDELVNWLLIESNALWSSKSLCSWSSCSVCWTWGLSCQVSVIICYSVQGTFQFNCLLLSEVQLEQAPFSSYFHLWGCVWQSSEHLGWVLSLGGQSLHDEETHLLHDLSWSWIKIMPRLHSFAVAIGFGLEHGGELRIPVVGRQMYVPWL